MNWYLFALKNYARFSGRARRKEYWTFFLINGIVAVVLIGIARASRNGVVLDLYIVYGLAVLLPSLAVLVRRLHDTGRSGVYFWIGVIPIIGGVLLLLLLATAGNAGPNQYGADPKAINIG